MFTNLQTFTFHTKLYKYDVFVEWNSYFSDEYFIQTWNLKIHCVGSVCFYNLISLPSLYLLAVTNSLFPKTLLCVFLTMLLFLLLRTCFPYDHAATPDEFTGLGLRRDLYPAASLDNSRPDGAGAFPLLPQARHYCSQLGVYAYTHTQARTHAWSLLPKTSGHHRPHTLLLWVTTVAAPLLPPVTEDGLLTALPRFYLSSTLFSSTNHLHKNPHLWLF